MSQIQTSSYPDSINAALTMRLCRVCHEEKPISYFRIGPSGRVKSICDGCTETLIAAYYGVSGLRRCTTCGRPTVNYRCGCCWKKIRGEDFDDNGYGFDDLL